MALRKARAAVGATAEIEAAAEELLGRGNAVDAVVAGVFAACAIQPGALLGPVQILVGGAGAGLLAIDGRVRQPGIGAPRPRGFMNEGEVPDAARIAAPSLPAALSVAIATMGSATFAQVMGPGAALAKGTPRAESLGRIAARGPRAIEEGPLGGELLAVAGRQNGGLLTLDDLATPAPTLQKAARVEHGAIVLTTFPWTRLEDGFPAPPAAGVDVARVRAVLAVDRNATFALACWDDATDGLYVEALGLRAPFAAEPVRRGQTRVRPGDPRPAAAPGAMLGSASAPAVAFAAFGAGDAYDVIGQAVRAYLDDGRIEAHGEARLVAVSHANSTASVLRG